MRKLAAALRKRLVGWSRWQKRLVLMAADAGAASATMMLAVALYSGHALAVDVVLPLALLAAALTPALGWGGAIYRTVVRYIAAQVALRIALVSVATAGSLAILVALAPFMALPWQVFVGFAMTLTLALGGMRLAARTFLSPVSDRHASNVLIYGAGSAGVQAAQGLSSDPTCRVVGFVDDAEDRVGTHLAEWAVYGVTDLPRLVERLRVEIVLLALPSATRRRKQAIIAALEPLPVAVKTVPSLPEILSGTAPIGQMRDMRVEDLLGRDPVPAQPGLLRASIQGRVVMVTGAGGSIGSELCRQIVALHPAGLILFEINEAALFHIEQDVRGLQSKHGAFPVTSVLGDVLDQSLVEACLRQHGVHTLYHAAAYKHVPLVEHNVRGGIRNNVLGTWIAANAALEAGVERFVLISTDKAVRPTNIMGATKRAAEMIIQDFARRAAAQPTERDAPGPVFSMVRFGNVLGSSGSVVPHFREQIENGGPVTVTHPEITRYFMTIPEAVQLVLQAGSMARGGEVFLLDMGEPIRIVDLATRMIRLAGFRVNWDAQAPDGIEIVYTGLRPGEKLYEELLIGEKKRDTEHPKIGCADESCVGSEQLHRWLDAVQSGVEKLDISALRHLLAELIPEYVPDKVEWDSMSTGGTIESVPAEAVTGEVRSPTRDVR